MLKCVTGEDLKKCDSKVFACFEKLEDVATEKRDGTLTVSHRFMAAFVTGGADHVGSRGFLGIEFTGIHKIPII